MFLETEEEEGGKTFRKLGGGGGGSSGDFPLLGKLRKKFFSLLGPQLSTESTCKHTSVTIQ
jgi:hypothetical protein